MFSYFGLFLMVCFSLATLIDSYQVVRLPSPRNTVGEVPHWDEKTSSLYYVDIAGNKSSLLRYDYRENRTYVATIDNAQTLLFILPIKCSKNHFLVGIDLKAVVVYWDGRSPKPTVLRTLFEVKEKSTNVINDIKTDFKGRLYFGTKSVESCDTGDAPTSSFYRYRNGRGLQKLFGDVFISNGLTWVKKTKKFYYIDSCTYDVREFDYNPRTGSIYNGHQIFSLGSKPQYILDGMTNDRDGNLYMATFGGNKVIKMNPRTRKVLLDIELPATQITSVAFGGPKLDILFVTTANKDGKQPEGSGYLYKVTGLKARGYAGVKINLCK